MGIGPPEMGKRPAEMTDTDLNQIAEQIATALDGHHTELGTYGHSILKARVWSKPGKTRVYVDKRHVGTDGTISRQVTGIGFVELLGPDQLVYDLKQERTEIRTIVEGLLK